MLFAECPWCPTFSMNNSKRLLELDVLRGIAALGVVLFHYTVRYNMLYHHSQELLVYFPYGSYGIELFFMISGFVIFMTLERSQNLDFVVGRFSRLYPAYWTAVLLTFTVVRLAGLPGKQISFGSVLLNLTMFQQFLHVSHVDGVYWTLELELSFYIIMFTLHKLRLLKSINSVAIGWLLLMVIAAVLEKHAFLAVSPNIKTFLLLNYANVFITGIMLYKIYEEGASIKRYAIIIACVLVYKIDHSWSDIVVFAAFVLVFRLISLGRFKFIRVKPLIFLGTISYTLYLVHQNIGYVVIRMLYKYEINPNVSILVAIATSITLASVITFLVEKPTLRLIRSQYRKTKMSVISQQD